MNDLADDPVSEGEVVSDRTPDLDQSTTNTSYIYASNESLDREYLDDRAKSIEDMYATIERNRKNVRSPIKSNLHTSLNSTISASNFITPEKLMEKLGHSKTTTRKSKHNSTGSSTKKTALKKSPKHIKENPAKKQLDLRSDQSSQTFVTSQVFTNTSPSRTSSATQANIPLLAHVLPGDLITVKDSQTSGNTSFETDKLFNYNNGKDVAHLQQQKGSEKVATLDNLVNLFLGDLTKAVEVVSLMITLGILFCFLYRLFLRPED